jgi:hypothetical protein
MSFHVRRYSHQKTNVLRNFVFWCICIGFHSLLAKFVYTKGISIGLLGKEPLYDLIQDLLPNLQSHRIIPEILHIIPVALLAYYTAIFWHRDCLSEFFLKHGSLMFLRGILFTSTLLPDSSQMCHLSNHFGGCFDLMFSGHSTITFLCTLLLVKHFPLSKFLKQTLFVNVFLTSILIILCRNHYTVDVVISLVLTYFSF